MSSKLDKPLDDIVSAKRQSARNRRPSQRRSAGPKAAAPVGGIQKNSKPARGSAAKPAPTKATASGESKVIVSNLPKDVSEQQIKEYFVQAVGPIKRVDLVYGPNSVSRGIANVAFHKSDGAGKAFQKLNGLLVDNRPIKIEIVVGAAQADKVMPAVKSLAERTAQPKPQPKTAASGKGGAGGVGKAGNGAKGAANKKRRGRNARPSKKTADELDTDMADYFNKTADGANNGAAANAAAPVAAATGDAPMEDEIMVKQLEMIHSPGNELLVDDRDKLSADDFLEAPDLDLGQHCLPRVRSSMEGGAKYGSSAGQAAMKAPLREARAASKEV
ncbi:RNA-binding RNA annealing protein [Conoideocrella luteorostrata]|uniref:RNA-binding RNA annealing protein n=1 Tax=Conoideocrella luteorostrata TaxID=1105319 RepID=A0AAJ0FTJ0_9HYPO|nr:RNA-binding RNA annealing protein [Conoideocrella luteorostrata]